MVAAPFRKILAFTAARKPGSSPSAKHRTGRAYLNSGSSRASTRCLKVPMARGGTGLAPIDMGTIIFSIRSFT